jgi:hypothetical protein
MAWDNPSGLAEAIREAVEQWSQVIWKPDGLHVGGSDKERAFFSSDQIGAHRR